MRVTSDVPYHPAYNYGFVALSIALSTLSAYVAVELASRITGTTGRQRIAWFVGGATAMGTGIWSMHYIGMLAFLLPVPVTYHLGTVLVSLMAAIFASGVALGVVSGKTLGIRKTALASVVMGGGIAAMHYIGMAAMRLPATCHYSSGLVTLSVVLAVVISMVALFLIFELREDKEKRKLKKTFGILLMGAAIPVMHYTGMAAAQFWPSESEPLCSGCVTVTVLGTAGIASGAFLILTVALIFAFFDRKLSEQNRQIESNDRRLRQLMASVQDILWQKDLRSGAFTVVSAIAEKLLGYPISDWLDDPLFLENHSVPEDRHLIALACAVSDGEPAAREFEHRLIAKDGRVVWLSTSIGSVASSDGSREIASVMQDITRKKAMQQELQQQRAYFEALMDSIPDYIYFKDLDSRFVRINKSMAQLFELATPEEAIGRRDSDFFGETHASFALAAEREIIQTGQRVLNLEEKEDWPDGTVSWVSTTKMPLRDPDGMISGTMGVSRDITERKLAETALLETTVLLQEANAELHREMQNRRAMEGQLLQAQKLESIGQLAAGVAHELNTPIQYVGDNCRFLDESFRGVVQILRLYDDLVVAVKSDKALPETVAAVEQLSATLDLQFLVDEIPAALKESIDGLDRAAQIIVAMKEFSHPGSRDKAPVDLNHAIASTLVVCRNEYKYVAELETDFEASLPPVYCLGGEINQVVLNLVVNAAHAITDKHPDGGGLIRVSTRLDEGYAEIRIQDNGGGIPEAIQDRVFDPFFTTKDVGKGSGQGLALARDVAVAKHNGSLRFETQEGKGTTFILRIPLDPPL